jgi:hypothetical protein
MGRVKVPRCDNCGAPVEFGRDELEARCQYCSEVLIREFPAQAPPIPSPVEQRYVPPAAVARHHKTNLWPILIATGTTLAIAGASGIATFATNLQLLPSSPPDVHTAAVVVPEAVPETKSFSFPTSETRDATTSPTSKAADVSPSRPRSAKPKTPIAPPPPPLPPEPPKPPPFDSKAAVAGLDAAKVKAESSCKRTSVKSLFVQMGFGPDGKNRGAALSDPKLNGTPEAKCVLKVFRAVSIPAFDPATKPSGLGRMVRLL